MQFTGFDHVQLLMPPGSEAAARAFYGDLLGFREVPKPEPLAARGGCWFMYENMGLHLSIDPAFSPAVKAHPALLVSDLEQLREHLSAAGVPITPDESVAHVRRFYATDPFGNRIEFIQQGDGFHEVV